MFKFLHDYLSFKREIKREKKSQFKMLRIYYRTLFKGQLYSWLGNYFSQKSCLPDQVETENYCTSPYEDFKNSFNEDYDVDDLTEIIANNVQQEQDEHGIIFDKMDKYDTIQLKDVIDINMEPNGDHSFVDYIYNVTDNQSVKEYIDQKRKEINGK